MAKEKEITSIQIRGTADLSRAMVALSNIEPSPEAPWTMTLTEGEESRSLKQNRLSFLWYRIRGGMTGHGAAYERNICKLMYGCPILREDNEFERFWLTAIDVLPFELQLDAMEYIPVTSLFTMHQFAEYLTEIDQQSAANGIVLPHPEDLYWDALLKEADREGI